MSRGHKKGRGGGRNDRAAAAPATATSAGAAAAAAPLELPQNAIIVDGSIMEGGGQVLRLSTACTAIMGLPLHVLKIRGKRSKPGLQAQHLTGINLVSNITRGRLEGNNLQSMEIKFLPERIQSGNYNADIGTAGSVCLLMQVSLPVLVFARDACRVTMGGGTNAENAPQIDYTLQVFKPIAARFGVDFDLDIAMRGYYPRGGGIVHMDTRPVRELQAVEMVDRGDLLRITGRCFVSGKIPAKVPSMIIASARASLESYFNGEYGPQVSIEIEEVHETPSAAVGDGTGIILLAQTSTGCVLASSGLGAKGVHSETVGKNCGEELIKQWREGGCVDEYLQDQLIIFMALARGTSRIRTGPLTLHTETAIHFAGLITGAAFTVTPAPDRVERQDGSLIVECSGIAFTNPNM